MQIAVPADEVDRPAVCKPHDVFLLALFAGLQDLQHGLPVFLRESGG